MATVCVLPGTFYDWFLLLARLLPITPKIHLRPNENNFYCVESVVVTKIFHTILITFHSAGNHTITVAPENPQAIVERQVFKIRKLCIYICVCVQLCVCVYTHTMDSAMSLVRTKMKALVFVRIFMEIFQPIHSEQCVPCEK